MTAIIVDSRESATPCDNILSNMLCYPGKAGARLPSIVSMISVDVSFSTATCHKDSTPAVSETQAPLLHNSPKAIGTLALPDQGDHERR